MQTIRIVGLNDLDTAAAEFAKIIQNHTIIAFYGQMGVGKTTFIAALCKQLGSNDIISSPTFSLINEYSDSKGQPIFHFDFYRIKSITEVFDIGYEDYLYSNNLCLLEWPELVEELLPDQSVNVNIKMFEATGERVMNIEFPQNNL